MSTSTSTRQQFLHWLLPRKQNKHFAAQTKLRAAPWAFLRIVWPLINLAFTTAPWRFPRKPAAFLHLASLDVNHSSVNRVCGELTFIFYHQHAYITLGSLHLLCCDCCHVEISATETFLRRNLSVFRPWWTESMLKLKAIRASPSAGCSWDRRFRSSGLKRRGKPTRTLVFINNLAVG